MGEKDVKSTTGTVGEIDTIGTAEGTENGSTGDRSSTSTGKTGSGRGRTGTGRTGRKSSSEGIENKTDSKISVLDEEKLPDVYIPLPAEKPTKQKRKYTRKQQPQETSTFNAEQLSALIVSISTMIASRDGMSHWIITEAEAKQISEPLSKMIEKSDSLKMLGEHADAFALVTACIMIFAPRIIITLQINKSKKGVIKNVADRKPKSIPKSDDKPNTGSSTEVHRKNADAHTNVDTSIFSTISPIQ